MSLYPKNPDNPQMSTVKTDETGFGDFVTPETAPWGGWNLGDTAGGRL